MSAEALLARLERAGARIALHGDQLDVDAPSGVLTPDVIGELRAAKPQIVALLSGTGLSCLDCRLTHSGPTACDGRAFLLGTVIEDCPAGANPGVLADLALFTYGCSAQRMKRMLRFPPTCS